MSDERADTLFALFRSLADGLPFLGIEFGSGVRSANVIVAVGQFVGVEKAVVTRGHGSSTSMPSCALAAFTVL